MDTSERAALYVQYLEAAAKEYRCATTDMPAKMAASRRLSFELYTSRLIEGHNPDPATLRWFLEEEQRCMPPPEIPKVEIAFAERFVGVCPNCKHETYPYEPPDPPPRPPTPPPTRDDAPSTPLPAAALPANVVPLHPSPAPAPAAVHPNDLPRRKPIGPHEWSGAPLKKYQAGGGYSGIMDGYSMTQAGPEPRWDAKHSLPSGPNWDVLPR